MRRAQAGLSLVEFSFVVVVVSILMLTFVDRVDAFRETAEKTAMEQLAREIGWALRLRAAELMLANRNDEIATLDAANPLEKLDMTVARYAGAGTTANETAIAAGSWYFNDETRELVYFPALTSNFVSGEGQRPRIAWHVIVVHEPTQPGGRARPQWVRFELAKPYRWLETASK